MPVIVRRLLAVPTFALLLLLTACTGTSPGKVDPQVAVDTADKGAQFAIGNGKLVAIVILVLVVGWFVGWLAKNKAIQILAAIAIGGMAVWFVAKGMR